MKTKNEQMRKLISLAHPLRNAVYASQVGGELDLDYLHQPTTGRITFREAVARFGRRLVQMAMNNGKVYLDDVVNVPVGAAFDPANATPTSRLYANGVTIG